MTLSNSESPNALSDLLVVELGSRIAAGVCGSLLAQLGATVVLVESAGQTWRGSGTDSKWDFRAQFAAGKRSIATPADQDDPLLANLLQRADVVIVSSDREPHFQDISQRTRADAVICDITAYASNGATVDPGIWGDADWQVQARAGLVATTGAEAGPPLSVPFPILEFLTGAYSAAAVLAALRLERADGSGHRIDMALYDCAFVSLTSFLPRLLIGEPATTRRLGNRHAMIAPWNVYRARDGWLLICAGSDAQWQRLCDLMNRNDLLSDNRTSTSDGRLAHADFVDDVVSTWTHDRSVNECVGVLIDVQIACGPVVEIQGYPDEANLAHRDMVVKLSEPISGRDIYLPGSPFRMSRTPGRHPDRIPSPDQDRASAMKWGPKSGEDHKTRSNAAVARDRPLEGIRVIEIGHYTTVPLAGRLLGSLGADVIKIEPPEGEATRAWAPAHDGQGYFFTFMNSDKRSLALDLRKDADADQLRKLLRSADVLIENLKPGALARRGFSSDALAELNPRLIYCSVSGFGSVSLYPGRPAFDSVIQAMSGVMDVLRAGDTPMKTGISSADLMGGEVALVSLLAALAYRDRTGLGQYLDLSMQDICAWLTQTAWGGASATVATLLCSDGAIVADISPDSTEEFQALTAAMTRTDAVAFFQQRGNRAAPVITVEETVDAPLTKARKLWFSVEAHGTSWPLLANPMRLNSTAIRVEKPISPLGYDNPTIIKELSERAFYTH